MLFRPKCILSRAMTILIVIFAAQLSKAGDLGFRYSNGKCLNAKGESGLNPTFFGQCADFRSVVAGNLNLDQIDFSGSSFFNADLQKTSFKNSLLVGVNFEGANLSGVKFDGAQIQNANFKKAKLRNLANFEANVSNSDFSEADFQTSLLSFAQFTNCVFIKASFESIQAEKVQFKASNLTEVNFDHADLTSANFEGSNLTRAIFISSKLTKADLSASIADGTKFNFSQLKESKLVKTSLKSAEFRNVDFGNSDFTNSDLTDADLRGANLFRSRLQNTILKGAKFSNKSRLPISNDQALALGMIFFKVTCDPKLEVEFNEACYYLDGSGGKCDPDYILAPQSIFVDIAKMFVGLNYKHQVSDNCCVWHSEIDSERQKYGMANDCNRAGPFIEGPKLGGTGCNGANNREPRQLTVCMTTTKN